MTTLNPAEHVIPNTPSSWKGGCDGCAHLVGEREWQECPGPGPLHTHCMLMDHMPFSTGLMGKA